jgi:hypothetical protein
MVFVFGCSFPSNMYRIPSLSQDDLFRDARIKLLLMDNTNYISFLKVRERKSRGVYHFHLPRDIDDVPWMNQGDGHIGHD